MKHIKIKKTALEVRIIALNREDGEGAQTCELKNAELSYCNSRYTYRNWRKEEDNLFTRRR